VVLDPLRIEVVRGEDGQPRVVAYDARELFDAANAALLDGRNEQALRGYDDLLSDFPDSPLAVPAMFNAGLAHEALGDWEAAIARYRAIARRDAPGDDRRDVVDAQIRLAAVLAELERWSESIGTLEGLLGGGELSPDERLEALARLGYALLESRDTPGAEEVLRQAIGYFEQLAATDTLDTDYYAAMARYYLAQIPHREFLAIPIRMPDKQTERDLETKADRVLIAHDRYLKTVEVGNVYWATAAGYQLAAMQKQFWDALVTAPIPPHLEPAAAEVYVEQVHKLSRQFLEKALATHERNVAFAEARAYDSVWVRASRAEAEVVVALLAREASGELPLPGDAGGNAPVPRESFDPPAARPSDLVPPRVDL
jgi:tetratricopeptide (TPR) repeat protein